MQGLSSIQYELDAGFSFSHDDYVLCLFPTASRVPSTAYGMVAASVAAGL
jgi:hypothetical protein